MCVASRVLRGVVTSSVKVKGAECRERQEDRDERSWASDRQTRPVFGEPGLTAGAKTAEEVAAIGPPFGAPVRSTHSILRRKPSTRNRPCLGRQRVDCFGDAALRVWQASDVGEDGFVADRRFLRGSPGLSWF